uniref:Uncharacterized protein n=1 Tax=Arundo donax TaxID=35708 RepID=A0A0A9H126_ARUDO
MLRLAPGELRSHVPGAPAPCVALAMQVAAACAGAVRRECDVWRGKSWTRRMDLRGVFGWLLRLDR